MTRAPTHQDRAYDALLEGARYAIRSHDHTQAEQLAREALAHAPERAAAYNILAAIRALQGHHAEAMDFLRAGIAVEPGYRPAQHKLERLGSYPHRRRILLGDEDE